MNINITNTIAVEITPGRGSFDHVFIEKSMEITSSALSLATGNYNVRDASTKDLRCWCLLCAWSDLEKNPLCVVGFCRASDCCVLATPRDH